jgi:autophagy-related protein 9
LQVNNSSSHILSRNCFKEIYNKDYIMIIGRFACSFSAFYFENHGNIKYGSPHNATRREQRSSQGKMEKSFLSFQSSYPSWESDSLGKQFLSNLRTFRDRKLHEINTRHSSPSRAWRESTNTPALYRDIPRNPLASGNHTDSMWLIDPDQRNHPYLLDWYYTSQAHNRTDHPIERANEILTANQNATDCWPPDLGIRGEDSRDLLNMEASTSGQFFRESILRHDQPEGEDSYGSQHPLDGRNQWWGRGNHSQISTAHPATTNSFIEPPDFINRYTAGNLLDNSWSRRSIEEEDEEEEELDWEENARRNLSRTTFMDDNDIEAGIDLHFDDVYSSRPQETSTSSTTLR